MSSLKDLTAEIHHCAERTNFARKLLKGLSPEQYYAYLYNQYFIYMALESHAQKLLPEIKDIFRTEKIYQDLRELELKYKLQANEHTLCPVVKEYEKHLQTLDTKQTLAHIYVRHFGDMYGGQIIKKRNPGSGTMYEFDRVEDLKIKIRSLLSDDMAEEANKCFEFAIKLFNQLDSQ
jgi:heme oxygenase (biliverdin-producing, ferredoxin)